MRLAQQKQAGKLLR